MALRRARTQPAEIASALKDQILLISFLVLFAGLVSTDTYYSAFGLRYQAFGLSAQHLIYRGITSLIHSWTLAISYLLAIYWLAAGSAQLQRRRPGWSQWLQLSTYGIVLLVTIVAYLAAVAAGQSASRADILEGSSRLPVVRSVIGSNGLALPFVGHRLLITSNESVGFFKAVETDAEVPFIHILRREDVREIVITR